MLSKLDRAKDAVQEGDIDLVCSLLKKFIQVTNTNTPTDDNGLTVKEERACKQEARGIRRRLGLRPGSDRPHRPDRSYRIHRFDGRHRARRVYRADGFYRCNGRYRADRARPLAPRSQINGHGSRASVSA